MWVLRLLKLSSGHCAKSHISPQMYWSSTDQMYYETKINYEKLCSTCSRMYYGCVYGCETSKFDFCTHFWYRNRINQNENTFRKKILNMDITGKWIQSLNVDSQTRVNFVQAKKPKNFSIQIKTNKNQSKDYAHSFVVWTVTQHVGTGCPPKNQNANSALNVKPFKNIHACSMHWHTK